MDEAALIAKLARIEALFAGAKTAGERVAAGEARNRIRARLRESGAAEKAIEFKFRMADAWSRRLFVALLRRYEIKPYRYKRQRYTTVMAMAIPSFVNETLWPQFVELNAALHEHLSEITDRVIGQAVHEDFAEAEEVERASLGRPG